MYSIHGKSGQSSLLIIIGLVVTFTLIWFINMFFVTTKQGDIIESLQSTKIIEYLDLYKGTTKHSLSYSVSQATKEIALNGGETNNYNSPRHWICNSDNSPDLETVEFFLSNRTKELFNSYLKNLEVNNQLKISLDNATKIDYDIQESKLNTGFYDESFIVNEEGNIIGIIYDENSVNSNNDMEVYIMNNRFWYMYRNFEEMTETYSFENCIENCMEEGCNNEGNCLTENCGEFDNCINSCFQNSVNHLENNFDQYVNCEYQIDCFWLENEKTSNGNLDEFTKWNDSHCPGCHYEIPENSISFASAGDYTKVKTSINGKITCTDNKYTIINGENLEFSIGINFKLQGIPNSQNCINL